MTTELIHANPHAALMADPTHISLRAGVVANPDDVFARDVLADWWQEHDRDDVAAMWRGTLPARAKTRKRVETMTAKEKAAMKPHAEKWIEIGLCTDPADRPMFEAAATQCYLAAKINPPRFVWCDSPLVAVAAAGTYAQLKAKHTGIDAVRDAVGVAVHGAVHGAVRDAVGVAVGNAVHNAVGVAVGVAVHNAVHDAVGGAVRDLWWRYLGGQFWVGDWYWLGSPSTATFCLDVLRLKVPEHLERAARAYAATASSACWWWPHRDVVFASERPHTIQVREGREPLVRWDGWEVGGEE